jgi:RHS repeat-associated protein
VQYPEDEDGTHRTEYEYDEMYRMAQAEMRLDDVNTLSANYTYEDGMLKTIQTPSTTYAFSYGTFDLRSSVMVGTKTLAQYHYDAEANYRLEKLDYGNTDNVQYEYDNLGRIVKESYWKDGATECDDFVAYTYDNDGNLATVFDSATGITTTYYYDLLGRALYYTKADATGQIQSVQYAYDVKNNLTGLTETVGNSTQGYVYEYDDDNRIIKVTRGNTTVNYTYDGFGRLIEKVTTQGETEVKRETYTFVNPTTTTTSTQVASYAVTAGGATTTWSYTYDKNGNILTISDGTHITRYEYDSANQLTAEYNEAGEYAHFWVYDNAGNIKSRTEYRYEYDTLGELSDTVNYEYDDDTWGDLLTSYDNQQIEYDGIGTPEEWGNRTFTWQRGRQMASLTENGTTWTYTYDADGMRAIRTNGAKTYTYTYNGSQLVQMTVDGNTLRFTYDAAGTPLTVTYDGETYYYVTNVQGDVVAIVNASGTKLVEYTYSSWGVVLQAEGVAEGENAAVAEILAELNPLLYCGYVYDTETALYYLQTRYYDPDVGRFVNADKFASTEQGMLGNNMFAYCLNNSINYVDPAGTLAYPGEIHNEVVRRIAGKYGYSKEQIILYKGGGFGRADLISPDGQVWDVKRDKPRQINAGKTQVENYVKNTWARSPDTLLSVGGNEIESGGFYYKSGLTTYKVTYRYAGDGVIAYDYRVSEFDYQTLATTVLVIGMAVVAGLAAGLPGWAMAYLALA